MTQFKGFKFRTTLVLMFKKIERDDKTKHETIMNESDIDDLFESICTTIILNLQKVFGKVLC